MKYIILSILLVNMWHHPPCNCDDYEIGAVPSDFDLCKRWESNLQNVDVFSSK